jgi:hypothetical protein
MGDTQIGFSCKQGNLDYAEICSFCGDNLLPKNTECRQTNFTEEDPPWEADIHSASIYETGRFISIINGWLSLLDFCNFTYTQ